MSTPELNRPEPPDLDLEVLARELPFPEPWPDAVDPLKTANVSGAGCRYARSLTTLPASVDPLRSPPTWAERDAATLARLARYAAMPPPPPQPRLDTTYLFGPDPIPHRGPRP